MEWLRLGMRGPLRRNGAVYWPHNNYLSKATTEHLLEPAGNNYKLSEGRPTFRPTCFRPPVFVQS